jgi:MFS family permease
MQPDTSGIKFGPFWLTPGISKVNATTFFFSSFTFVTLVAFLPFVQPYLLNDVLNVPADQQGRVSGVLSLIQECTALVLMGVMGALSDRAGRRAVGVVGMLILAVGAFLYPMAEDIFTLGLFRVVVGVGVATLSVTVIATMQDYPQEVSRGKWGGTNSFITSFAILLVSLALARIPGWLEAAGYEPPAAARYTYWFAAGACIIAAGIIRLGWYGGRFGSPAQTRKKSAVAGFIEGLGEARRNPRLGLAYLAAFAARGDMAVIGLFFSLWFVRAGGDAGIESTRAMAQAGMTLGALTLAVCIWAPTFGWLLDRIDRVTGMAIAMALACVGYFAVGNVADPFDMAVAIPAVLLLGVGEISAVVAGNALLGQEAPPQIRGAAAGVFSWVGTFGILSATVVGGIVFDKIAYSAPFTMMAIINGVVVIAALLVRSRGRTTQTA